MTWAFYRILKGFGFVHMLRRLSVNECIFSVEVRHQTDECHRLYCSFALLCQLDTVQVIEVQDIFFYIFFF